MRLTRDSSCIDAADGDVAPLTDILGLARVIIYDVSNGVGEPDYVDIGAYEFNRGPGIVVMCWIDESKMGSGYYGTGGNFNTDLTNYQNTVDSAAILVESGCLVPSDPNPDDPYYYTIEDVLPYEYEYDPSNPPEGISVEVCNRPPDLNEFKSDFLRICNGVMPYYLLLVVDNSGSMSTGVIQPGYDQFKNWFVTEYGAGIVQREPTYCHGECERWVDEITKGINDILN